MIHRQALVNPKEVARLKIFTQKIGRISLTAALFVLLCAGCSEETGEPPVTNELPAIELTPPENGFQIMVEGSWVQPGESQVFCEYIRIDGDYNDHYYVKSLELNATPWVHHVLATFVIPEGVSAEDEGLVENLDEIVYWPLDFDVPVGPTRCGWADENIVSRHEYYPLWNTQFTEESVTFPEGTGRQIRGGLYLMIEYHFTNPTTEPIPARVGFNFHLVDETPDHLLTGFTFTYNNIDVPPHTKKSFAAQCVFEEDLMVWGLRRHTHEFGTAFHVWHVGGERDGEYIWSSYDWDNQLYSFEEGAILVEKGSGFRFQCDYNNTQDKILIFGQDLGQEMCLLMGMIWSLEPGITIPVGCLATKVDVVDPETIGLEATEGSR